MYYFTVADFKDTPNPLLGGTKIDYRMLNYIIIEKKSACFYIL